MTIRLALGALLLLVTLVGLPACAGTRATATPGGEPIELVVDESIAVSDDAQVLPSVIISVDEAVAVADDVQVLPSLVIFVSETIAVADDAQVLPVPQPTAAPAPTPMPAPSPELDLAIEKLLDSAFHYGRSGSYAFRIWNVGAGIARSPITMVDDLPDGFTFDSYSDPFTTDWACTASGQRVTCAYNGPDISPGGFLPALVVTVTVAPIGEFPEGSGAVENCAQIRQRDDVNPANDESCVSTAVTPSGAAA